MTNTLSFTVTLGCSHTHTHTHMFINAALENTVWFYWAKFPLKPTVGQGPADVIQNKVAVTAVMI